jgi:hypothetical protein
MSDTNGSTRFCLRDLPLPAKVVVTSFLFAVGLGYSAALVQMHFQDSKSGAAMPTMDDVILKFTGKKKLDGAPPAPVSQFVRLITAPEEGLPFNGSGTMSPAFFSKSKDFVAGVRSAPHTQEQLRAERTGERDVLVMWANSDPETRRNAYAIDHFGLRDKMPAAITPKFQSAPDAVRVKSIIDTRCAVCHVVGGEAERYPLVTYPDIEKYLEVKPAQADGGWVRVQEPMSLTRLTQSTHAHLLSFAVLFSLTGLVFAFTSYPTGVRCMIAPLALVAIVTDVAFWWLARMSENYGVYFAMGVVGTGGLAGLALGAQIVLSLWNMYGPRGKLVILLLFALAGTAGALVMNQVILPGLNEKQTPKVPTPGNGGDGGRVLGTKASALEGVLRVPNGPDGKPVPVLQIPFKQEPDWNMVRALFDQDSDEWAAAKRDKDQKTIDALMPERHGEFQALVAWMKLPDAERKKTFDADAFDLPAAAKQATPRYVKGGKFKIQSLITDRCVRCHAGDVKEENRFDSYEAMRKFLEPQK